MNKTLETLRKEIDQIDHQLLQLLKKRMDVVQEIGKVKRLHAIAPFDGSRWKQLLNERLIQAKKMQLSESFIRSLFRIIHDHAVSLQK